MGLDGWSGLCFDCFFLFFSFFRFFLSLSSSWRFPFLCFFSWVSPGCSLVDKSWVMLLSYLCFLSFFLCFLVGVALRIRYFSGSYEENNCHQNNWMRKDSKNNLQVHLDVSGSQQAEHSWVEPALYHQSVACRSHFAVNYCPDKWEIYLRYSATFGDRLTYYHSWSIDDTRQSW